MIFTVFERTVIKLFGKKRKNIKSTVENKIFGCVKYSYNWMTAEPVRFNMYGKDLLMDIQICTDNKEDPILKAQEDLYELFRKTKAETERNVENVLNNEFPFPEGCHKADVFSGGMISFSTNKKCGLMLDISEEYSDFVDIEGIGVFSDKSLCICLLPEIFIINSTDIFEELFG